MSRKDSKFVFNIRGVIIFHYQLPSVSPLRSCDTKELTFIVLQKNLLVQNTQGSQDSPV
jgi:hypothetical protein